jgi:mRNA-degrading endonuclease RelE of RelBE toxin-antitoxin system
MSAAEIIKELPKLTRAEQEQLRDLLDHILEDELEFTDEFKAKIERGDQDIREGRVRVHKP